MKASKILALVLTIALLVAALPTTALAQNYNVSTQQDLIDALNAGGGTVTMTGDISLIVGIIVPANVTLNTGNNALTIEPGVSLYVQNGGTLNVESGGELIVENGGELAVDGTLNLNGGTLDLREAGTSYIDNLELNSGNLVVDNEPTVDANGFVDDIYDYLSSQFNSNPITNITVTGTGTVTITLMRSGTVLGTLSALGGGDAWTFTPYKPAEEDKTPTRTTTRERSTPLVTFGIYYYRNISAGESFFSWDNGYIQPTTIKIMETIPTRAGYRFLYWTSDPGGDGQRYKPGDAFLLFADVNLYAQWEKTQAAPQPDEDDYNPPSGR